MTVLLELYAPRETVNDEVVTIAKLYFRSGDAIEKGDILVDLETSKATLSIEAELGGVLDVFCEEGQDVSVGSLLMNIVDNKNNLKV